MSGRTAVIALVLSVLALSYAYPVRTYLEQRAEINRLRDSQGTQAERIAELEEERAKWDDPAYVKAQARARFGYLMPGEAGFEVIGPDGEPLEAQASLNDPDDVIKTVPTAWWTSAWESMELAGNPPPPEEEPVDLVDGTKQ